MKVSSPYVIVLDRLVRQVLTARARSGRGQHRDVLRARIVLAAADDRTNSAIAAELAISVETVRKWRKRFHAEGMAGLTDRPRSGRPRVFTATQVAQVKALACTPPEQAGVPLSQWSVTELANEAVGQGMVDMISPATVARWLAADAIKPWQHRSWIFPRDPTSKPKPPGCWTCTSAAGTAVRSARTST